MKRAGHQLDPRRDADGPIVPEGQGYQEIIAMRRMRKADARKIIGHRRREEKRLMRARGTAVENSLIHETPAMACRLPGTP